MVMKKVAIVIPTYNEKDSIRELIRKLNAIKLPEKLDVIIVDDNSPDGTADVVKRLKSDLKITLIKREKKLGLGSAYVEGFQKPLNHDVDFIFQMDADLSHDPKYIPTFIEEINKGYDVVVGSRLMKGGGVVGWNFTRRLISWGGNLIGKFIAGINVSDLTSGYRVYKRGVLETIDLNKIKSSSYDFQLEILAKALKKGFRVGTIPIIFHDRKYGESKLTRLDQLRFLMTALKIRFGML